MEFSSSVPPKYSELRKRHLRVCQELKASLMTISIMKETHEKELINSRNEGIKILKSQLQGYKDDLIETRNYITNLENQLQACEDDRTAARTYLKYTFTLMDMMKNSHVEKQATDKTTIDKLSKTADNKAEIVKKLEADLINQNKEITSRDGIISRLKAEMIELQSRLQSIEEERINSSFMEKELNEELLHTSNLEIEKLKADKAELDKVQTEMSKQMQELRNQLENSTNGITIEKLTTRYNQLAKDKNFLLNCVTEKNNQVARLESEQSKFERSIRQLRDEKSALTLEVDELKQDAEYMRRQVEMSWKALESSKAQILSMSQHIGSGGCPVEEKSAPQKNESKKKKGFRFAV